METAAEPAEREDDSPERRTATNSAATNKAAAVTVQMEMAALASRDDSASRKVRLVRPEARKLKMGNGSRFDVVTTYVEQYTM